MAKFSLTEQFIDKYRDVKPPFGFDGLGELVYYRCVTVDTPILMKDLTWRTAGEVREGDEIIAFEEETEDKYGKRYLRNATITHNKIEPAGVMKITLEDGTILHATPDHRWLAKPQGFGQLKWIRTDELKEGARGAPIFLPRFLHTWERDASYEAGFLAAALDGEGSLDKANGIVFVQSDNAMLAEVERCLNALGFAYTKTVKSSRQNRLSKKDVYRLGIYGKTQILRLLGQVRPPRLLALFLENNVIENMTLKCKNKDEMHVRVVDVSYAGEMDIAVISTSEKTHFTDGFPSHNTYSRLKEDGTNEHWWETVRRVVEGTYEMQREWIEQHSLGWNPWKAQKSAQEMYDRIFNMKFLPPGRGLWAMGTEMTRDRKLFAALNNCGFTSTSTIKEDLSKSFCFLMDMSMLGVGIGFDLKGAGKIVVKQPSDHAEIYSIPDTREGWVESVRLLLDSYFTGGTSVLFDYSQIRPAGEPIKGFGGVASGPGPLKDLHSEIHDTMSKNVGEPITATTITDVMNMIGKCVVAGNVRRTAEIVFGDPFSDEYLDLKNYEVNPHREEYGWTSNNSIFAELGMDYGPACERVVGNGEPGFAWLDNMQNYSRMNNGPDFKDSRAAGGNPCLEQTLESYELCCLVESFPDRHEDLEDYLKTLKYAYLYAKTVTLGKTHWPETNRVLLRNRRIGCSVSGVAQFLTHRGIHTLREWLMEGYDEIQRLDRVYSDWLAVPRSIKTTSVKPSGTVSLLAGSTPGMHYPEARFYIRRIRLSVHSPLLKPLAKAGYHIEPDQADPENTMVVEIPVDVGEGIREVAKVSIWEQLSLAAFLQRYWADNQVSCTVTFDPKKDGDDIKYALNYLQYQLKGVSFLPRKEKGAYAQMPYEAIDEERYTAMRSGLKTLNLSKMKEGEESKPEMYCSNDTCIIL